MALTGALQDLWVFTAASLEYQPVGFGSHHWLATDATGRRLFATADDLAAKGVGNTRRLRMPSVAFAVHSRPRERCVARPV